MKVSGERRFRAISSLKLKHSAYVRIANDQQSLEMALVENIQRKNLDLSKYFVLSRLIEEVTLSQS